MVIHKIHGNIKTNLKNIYWKSKYHWVWWSLLARKFVFAYSHRPNTELEMIMAMWGWNRIEGISCDPQATSQLPIESKDDLAGAYAWSVV